MMRCLLPALKHHRLQPVRGVWKQTALLLCLMLITSTPGWSQDREDPLARFKKDTDTYLNLWNTGKYAESLEFLENAIINSTDGVPMRWLYDRAELQFAQGRVDDAISEIEWLHYRRPSPKSALQLALFQYARGHMDDYQRTLERAANRYRRFKGEKDDTENTIAIIRIREILGENPRSLFQELLKIEDDDPEDKVAVHLATGDLAWRKFDYQLASTEYEKALTLDPNHLEALAGLAECYWRSADERLDATMDRVLAVNPTHPRILGIKVEMALDAGFTKEALEMIELVLAANPHNMRFMGLKSAAHFIDDDLDEMLITQQRALLFNRFASDVYRITGRLASRHYRFAEAAEFQKSALEIYPEDHVARALYAFDLLRLGEDKKGREQLEQAFEADRFNVQVYNMLELMDTLAGFHEVKVGPFLLKMPKEEFDVWGQDVVKLLNDAYTHFEKAYDIKLDRPIHIQIFDNHDDFMVRSIGLPGAVGYLGICFGKLVTMDSPSARNKGTMNWQATLWHEFVHVVTLQKTRNRMPRWLSEGISVYEETQVDPAWGQRPNPQYKPAVSDGIPELKELELLFTQPKTPMHVSFGYYIAGEFVRFYVETYGQNALANALAAIGDGENTNDALIKASNTSLKAMNKGFAEYMKPTLEHYKNLPTPEPDLLQRLAGGTGGPAGGGSPFTSALNKANEALREERFDEAERWLAEADALFPGMIGPSSPLTLLAGIYEKQEQKEQHLAVRKKLFELDGTDWQTCHVLAELYTENQDWENVAKTAQRGLAIDPFDIEMRRSYRDAMVAQGKQKAALAALDSLIHLDPDRAIDYRIQRLDLQIEGGLWTQARNNVLELLEQIPYSWEAQRRLLMINDQLKDK